MSKVEQRMLETTLYGGIGYHFYRAKRSVARYCHYRLSVYLSSVCPSVTLVDCDHTRWNSIRIISRLISLETWLSADPNFTDLLEREHF